MDSDSYARVMRSTSSSAMDEVRDNSTQRRTPLSCSACGGEHYSARGQVEVGGRRHDRGIVTPELEQHSAESLGDAGSDCAAHARRTGRRQQRHPRIVDECFTRNPITDDELSNFGIDACIGGSPFEQRLHSERSQRRLLRRLPDDGVSGDQGQHRIPRPDGDREVERRDDADDAEGVPLFHHSMARSLGGDGVAVELAGQTDPEVADIDHFLNLTEALGHDLACLDGDKRSQIFLVLAQQFAQLPDQSPANRRRHRGPLGKCGLRVGDDGIHIRDGRRGERAQIATGDGRTRHNRQMRLRDVQVGMHTEPIQDRTSPNAQLIVGDG